jgi:hypothetical protein
MKHTILSKKKKTQSDRIKPLQRQPQTLKNEKCKLKRAMPKSISFLTPAFWGWADIKSSLRRSVDGGSWRFKCTCSSSNLSMPTVTVHWLVFLSPSPALLFPILTNTHRPTLLQHGSSASGEASPCFLLHHRITCILTCCFLY